MGCFYQKDTLYVNYIISKYSFIAYPGIQLHRNLMGTTDGFRIHIEMRNCTMGLPFPFTTCPSMGTSQSTADIIKQHPNQLNCSKTTNSKPNQVQLRKQASERRKSRRVKKSWWVEVTRYEVACRSFKRQGWRRWLFVSITCLLKPQFHLLVFAGWALKQNHFRAQVSSVYSMWLWLCDFIFYEHSESDILSHVLSTQNIMFI